MDTKKILKNLKLNESTISMFLGVVVVLVVGVLIYRYFTGLNEDNVDVPGVATEQNEDDVQYDEEGREVYVVVAGDSLWDIAEKKLDDGYDWVKIAALNNIVGNYELREGQEIVLPTTEPDEPKLAANNNSGTEQSEPEKDETETEAPQEQAMEDDHDTNITNDVMAQEDENIKQESGDADTDQEAEITSDKYIVVHGDNLWTIAERAYGDGYKWVDIAEANNLDNPDIIHAGNEFTLPR